MSTHPNRSALDGLPEQFIASMRTLFEIMDEQKTGFIKFSDIEIRWREDETKRLPKGVVECLKKVTPSNGMLTFERFCAGLKICLLRNKTEFQRTSATASGDSLINGKPPLPNNIGSNGAKTAVSGQGNARSNNMDPIGVKKVPSQSVLPTITTRLLPPENSDENVVNRKIQTNAQTSIPESSHFQPSRLPNSSITATVRPNISSQQRALSMPLLEHLRDGTTVGQKEFPAEKTRSRIRTELRGYRSESKISETTYGQPLADTGTSEFVAGNDANLHLTGAPRSRRGIMTVLHNWHMGMLNEADKNRNLNAQTKGNPRTWNNVAISPTTVTSEDARNFKTAEDFTGGVASDGDVTASNAKEASHFMKKGNARRREPRRHTLANGIDYNMLKRMKQLEQEKDILLQGLEAIDKARSWYLKQIVSVQEKMKYIGQNNGHLEYSTEAHQERLNFQMAQIFEVNQHLSSLVESTERGFPLHMNLAIRQMPQVHKRKSPLQVVAPNAASSWANQEEAAVNHLKEMNHLLSEEVSKKSERITQLEREKAALVRELFQARSITRRETDDTTLM